MSDGPVTEDGKATAVKPDRWRSRPFGDPSARGVIAECLSKRDYAHFEDIPPKKWADSGAVIAALRAAGFTITRRPS